MDKTILDKIESIAKQEAEKENLQFVSCRFYHHSTLGNTLEILVDKDFQITLDEIDKYTNNVSILLDDIEEFDEPYMLDVCSGGSEREIQFEDLYRLIEQYIDIDLNNGEKLLAKLLNYNEEEIEVVYFIKGRKKKQIIKFEDIKSIHMGYKN